MTQVLLMNSISQSLITESVLDDDQIYPVYEVSPFIMFVTFASLGKRINIVTEMSQVLEVWDPKAQNKQLRNTFLNRPIFNKKNSLAL